MVLPKSYYQAHYKQTIPWKPINRDSISSEFSSEQTKENRHRRRFSPP